jgi:hypothetical protein
MKLILREVANRYKVPIHHVFQIYNRGFLPPPERVGHYRVVDEADLPAVEAALIKAGYARKQEPAMAG